MRAQAYATAHVVRRYCLGVLIYEMLVGESPFASAAAGGNLSLFQAILRAPTLVRIPSPVTRSRVPTDPVAEAEELDIVRRLLCRDTIARLGCGRDGGGEVLAHPWIARHIDLERLKSRELPAPWRPACATASDTRYFGEYSDSESETEGPCASGASEGYGARTAVKALTLAGSSRALAVRSEERSEQHFGTKDSVLPWYDGF